jgi:diguanylate cyclase (GGDEF)-like protein
VVLAEIAEAKDAALVAETILSVFTAPVLIAGRSLQITTSIGIAIYPLNGIDDAQELMKKADKAMYAAKAAGRNSYRFFSD